MLGSQISFGLPRIAIRSLSLFCLVILRTLMSRCNHGMRSKSLTLIDSIARLASDPLQHVVIEHCRPDYTVLSLALPSVCLTDFKFENCGGNRAAAEKLGFPNQRHRRLRSPAWLRALCVAGRSPPKSSLQTHGRESNR